MKNNRMRRTISLVLSTTLIMSVLAGCKSEDAKSLKASIMDGEYVKVQVSPPSTFNMVVKGESREIGDWVQLDQLKTYNDGFRQEFDDLFNINIVFDNTQASSGGKQGALFVKNVDGEDVRDGNTSLMDAFRNETFIEDYWSDDKLKLKMGELASKLYDDIDEHSAYGVNAALNAYYNIFPDYENPACFNATKALTREEFYTFLVRATEGVHELELDNNMLDVLNENRVQTVDENGGSVELSDLSLDPGMPYVSEMQGVNWINIENGCLSELNLTRAISRAEAVYMITNLFFPDELAKVTGAETAYTDTLNAGDLALKVGFKEMIKNPDKTTTEKVWDKWELYTLEYMMRNTDKGMQEELYKPMVVANKLNLLTPGTSRWNEGISRSEAMDLIINTAKAMNKLYGYATEEEYAKIVIAEEQEPEEDTNIVGAEADIVISSTIEILLDEMEEEWLNKFSEISEYNIDLLESGEITADELEEMQLAEIDILIENREMPENSKHLFQAWKKLNGLYDNHNIHQELVAEDLGTGLELKPEEEDIVVDEDDEIVETWGEETELDKEIVEALEDEEITEDIVEDDL